MVYASSLENCRFLGTGPVGSNPTLSSNIERNMIYVDTDTFGPTGKMKRREAIHLKHSLTRCRREHRWPAFFWRVYPPMIVEVHRRHLRKLIKKRTVG